MPIHIICWIIISNTVRRRICRWIIRHECGKHALRHFCGHQVDIIRQVIVLVDQIQWNQYHIDRLTTTQVRLISQLVSPQVTDDTMPSYSRRLFHQNISRGRVQIAGITPPTRLGVRVKLEPVPMYSDNHSTHRWPLNSPSSSVALAEHHNGLIQLGWCIRYRGNGNNQGPVPMIKLRLHHRLHLENRSHSQHIQWFVGNTLKLLKSTVSLTAIDCHSDSKQRFPLPFHLDSMVGVQARVTSLVLHWKAKSKHSKRAVLHHHIYTVGHHLIADIHRCRRTSNRISKIDIAPSTT